MISTRSRSRFLFLFSRFFLFAVSDSHSVSTRISGSLLSPYLPYLPILLHLLLMTATTFSISSRSSFEGGQSEEGAGERKEDRRESSSSSSQLSGGSSLKIFERPRLEPKIRRRRGFFLFVVLRFRARPPRLLQTAMSLTPSPSPARLPRRSLLSKSSINLHQSSPLASTSTSTSTSSSYSTPTASRFQPAGRASTPSSFSRGRTVPFDMAGSQRAAKMHLNSPAALGGTPIKSKRFIRKKPFLQK